MRILIVEDEFTARAILIKLLSPHGDCEVAVNGKEAIQVFNVALSDSKPYDLVCLDINLPEASGHEVLAAIREQESKNGILPDDGAKVIMTTATSDPKVMMKSFREGCEAYLLKPIDRSKLFEELKKLELA